MVRIKKVSTKESTYYHYVYVVNKYLMPTFGNMTIKQLKRYNYIVRKENNLRY